jgi:preprotein translocase subunit SecA
MAGRGTDILLGGNPEFLAQEEALKVRAAESIPAELSSTIADTHYYYFIRGDLHYRVPIDKWKEIFAKFKAQCDEEHDRVVAVGGLCIIGTERHESRRIDNQLRGRAGRQGDPGESRFYLSLQDDLLRVFGGDRIQNLMLRLGMEEDVPIESRLITKRIEAAQKAVEAQNFAIRKHVKEYDDVMDKQRKAIYGLRRQLLEGRDMKERLFEIVDGILASFIDARCPEGADPYKWDLAGLQTDINSQFGVKILPSEIQHMSRLEMEDYILGKLRSRYDEKEALVGPEVMRETERMVWLSVIDQQWKDHLLSMDHLKEGIGMRAYGQKDPLIEYKKEGFQLFQEMMDRIEDETVRFLFFLQPAVERARPFAEEQWTSGGDGDASAGGSEDRKAAQSSFVDLTRNIQRKKERELEMLQFAGGEASSAPKAQVIKGAKVGRNDPCPCGSGKKYKKCCGA